METRQDDKDLEPKIQPDEIQESAQRLQDDKMDLECEMQQNEIEKSALEMQDEQNPGPTITDVLALHCLQFIFAYLTINDLVRSERVSHDWRQFVQEFLPMVQNYRISYCNHSPCKVPDRKLSFRTIKLAMGKGEISKMISKMGKYFVRVYSDCIDEEDSKALAVHCPHLEYLLLSGTHIKLVFDGETDEESQRRKLTGIFLTNLRMNLKTLGLSFFKPFNIEYLQSAIHRLTGLTRLDLNSISVETLQSVSTLLEQMPLLEHLSLMEYERGRESGIDPPCFDRLSRLRELHLWGNEFVTDSWVEAAATCEALRVFNVGTCFEVTMKAVLALCQRRKKLTELVVSKLRVTNADLEACFGYCSNLELLDVSWCTRLTRDVLPRLLRPITRPLIVRLHGTRITENDISYYGLFLRVDLPPVLYNPLQVRYASSYHNHGVGHFLTEPDYLVLEHAIAMDRPEEHADGNTLPVVHVGARGDVREENAMHIEDTSAADAIRGEIDKRVEDAARATDAVPEEDGILEGEIMRADNSVCMVVDIDAVDAVDGRRAEDDLGQENRQVTDERFLPVERCEDDLRLSTIPEDEVREIPIVSALDGCNLPQVFQNELEEHVLRAIIQAGDNLLHEHGFVEIDPYPEDNDYPEDDAEEDAYEEDDSCANDYYDAEDYQDDADDDHDDDINVDFFLSRNEPEVNGFHPEEDIYPEDDILVDNEREMLECLRVVEIHVEDGMFAIEGILPFEEDDFFLNQEEIPAHSGNSDLVEQVSNRIYDDYGSVCGNDAPHDQELFADDVLFAQDELSSEDDYSDNADI